MLIKLRKKPVCRTTFAIVFIQTDVRTTSLLEMFQFIQRLFRHIIPCSRLIMIHLSFRCKFNLARHLDECICHCVTISEHIETDNTHRRRIN